MTAATINFILYPYADFTESVTYRDSAGDPIDLTGATGRAQVRRDITDPDPMLDLSTTDGTIVFGGVNGTIAFAVDNSDTGALDVDYDGETWVYDMLITFSGGTVERTLQGAISVVPGVTRPA